MSYTIQCTKCGHQNVLGRIFCTSCGQKLDFTQVDTKPLKRVNTHHALARTVRLFFVFLVIAVSILILKPATTAGSQGNLQDAQRLNQKLRSIKAAILDGKAFTQDISESEVNGYLVEVLKRTAESTPKDKKPIVNLRQINVRFTADEIHVVLLAGIGPVTLSYAIAGKPAKADSQFTIVPDSVRLGSLPLPTAMGHWIAGRVAFVFSRLSNEKTLLDQVSTMHIEDGRVIVAVQAAQ